MQKRFFRVLVSALLVCAVLGGATAFAENATVTGSDVNLRSGPGTSYPVLDSLPRGAVVNVTDRSNGSWYAVSYNGVSGYMSSSYLSIQEDGASAAVVSAASTSVGYVSADYVRFRSGPGTNYSMITTYNRGKQVTITGSSGSWIACTVDGQSGYIFGDYISSTAPAPAAAQQNTASVSSAPAVNEDGSSNAVLIGGGSSGGSGGSSSGGGASASVTVTPAPSAAAVTATPAPSQDSGSATLIIPASPGDGSAAVTTAPEPSPAGSAGNSATAVIGDTNGAVNADYVRFRVGPGTNYSIIASYNRGTAVSVTGQTGDWYACTVGAYSGYIFSQYVTVTGSIPTQTAAGDTGDNAAVGTPAAQETPAAAQPAASPAQSSGTPGYITGNNVRFRSGASMSSGILCELFYGNVVSITGTVGDWTAVTYDGKSGYVYSQYVSTGSFQAAGGGTQSSGTAPVTTGGATGQQLVDYALQYLGYRYAWGGKTPETGFDCSGFMYYVYGQFGYTLNRVAADQAKNGVHVDAADIQPGDLICFYSGGSYIGHVGMYIGNNQFVHSATSSTGVIISDLSGYYATRGYEVRRIV